MFGAYIPVRDFAYPGWRLTVPGGPAGGQYHGYTHNYGEGTDMPPEDSYEQDREDGMSSHDAAFRSPRAPRGVYRSSGEVPPRPNASGSAMTYRGYQTAHDPGDAVSPGSFPAEFVETLEDAFLSGVGISPMYDTEGGAWEGIPMPSQGSGGGGGPLPYPFSPVFPAGGEVPPQLFEHTLPIVVTVPSPGPTSIVKQPPATELPARPSPTIPVFVAPPVSPRPAPVVRTRDVVPIDDGSGDFFSASDGSRIPASAVEQDLATGIFRKSSGDTSWFEQHSIWAAIPNWAIVAAGGLFLLNWRRR